MSAYEAGMEQLRMGDADRARKEFEKLPPGSAEALYGLGLLADLEGDLAKAEELLTRANAADPKRADLACHLAMLHLARDENDRAEKILEPALKAHPTDENVNLHLAMALAKSSVEKARAHVTIALKSEDESIKGQARALYSTLAEHSAPGQ